MSGETWSVPISSITNFAPMVPTIAVNSAPPIRPNRMTPLRQRSLSRLISTSTPTWMPVRTP